MSPPTYKAVRRLHGNDDELYLDWYENDDGVRTLREYYHLGKDPFQVNALASGARPDALEKILAQLAACKGESCRLFEDSN